MTGQVARNVPRGLGEQQARWRAWSQALLAVYVVLLVWVVLFKLSFDIPGIVRDYQTRILNLVPFAGVTWADPGELIANVVVFVPLGLLLGMTFGRVAMWMRLVVVCALSVALELTQYVLAIGRTDVTDVLMNTLGGVLGLVPYSWAARRLSREKLDLGILVAGTVLLVSTLLLRFFVLRVRY